VTREVSRTAAGDLDPRVRARQRAVDSGYPELWLEGWVDWDVIEARAGDEEMWLDQAKSRAAKRQVVG
jgi:hypothetical protein